MSNLIGAPPLRSRSADTRRHPSNKYQHFLDCFVSREVTTLNRRPGVSMTELLNAGTLKIQLSVSKFIRLHFGYKGMIQKAKVRQLRPVISPGLLLTTWLISTTSPEQRDEHQAILLRTQTERQHKYKSKKSLKR